jgi:hypothetical protein
MFFSSTLTSLFGTTAVVAWPPSVSGAGCDTSCCSWISTVRPPCAIATSWMRTAPPTTMVPVRSSITTFAEMSGSTSITETAASSATGFLSN